MADDLTIKSPGAGTVGANSSTEQSSALSPQEEEFKAFVAAARQRGVNIPESALLPFFQREKAKVAAQDAKAASSQAHFAEAESNTLQTSGASHQSVAADVTGTEKSRNITTGLTPEVEKRIASDLRSEPILPPANSVAISAEQSQALLTEILINRTSNGEPVDIESVFTQANPRSGTQSKTRSNKPSPVRVGTGGGALSMRIGGGGTNLPQTSNTKALSSSSSPLLEDMDFSWQNLEAFFILFMMHHESSQLESRKALKELRRLEAESSLASRKLDIGLTELNQNYDGLKSMLKLVEEVDGVSDLAVKTKTDNAFPLLDLEKSHEDIQAMQGAAKQLQGIVADVTGAASNKESDSSNQRTFLTDTELDALRNSDPDKATQYTNAMQNWQRIAGPARKVALMRQDALRLTPPQRDAYAQQSAVAQRQLNSGIVSALQDPRGMGLALGSRDAFGQELKKLQDQEEGLSQELEDLNNSSAKAGDGSAETNTLQSEIEAKKAQLDENRRSQMLEMETLTLMDNALVARRHNGSDIDNNPQRLSAALDKDREELSNDKAALAKLGPARVERSGIEQNISRLESKIERAESVEQYHNHLMNSYRTRTQPDDLAALGSRPDLSTENGSEITSAIEPLPTDLDERFNELDTRVRAGYEFFKPRERMYSVNSSGADWFTKKLKIIRSGLNHFDSFRNVASKQVQASAGTAKSNQKQTGALISKTRPLIEQLLRTAAKMRKSKLA